MTMEVDKWIAKAQGMKSKEHHLGSLDGINVLSPSSSWPGAGTSHNNTVNVFEKLSQLCAAQQSACLAAAGMRPLALDMVKMQFL